MSTETAFTKLNRFTTLPVLLRMLKKKSLVFSDPKFWDDENDTELLEIYRKRKISSCSQSEPAKSLLALCFLKEHETIHHWKAFANGISGCCIEFDKTELIKLLFSRKNDGDNLRFGSVVYKRFEEINDGTIDDCVEMLPFIKRWPYRFEKEFRVIWEGDKNHHEIKIDNIETIITKITISQTMPSARFEKIKEKLRDIATIEINPSTVYRNEEKWIDVFKQKFENNPSD